MRAVNSTARMQLFLLKSVACLDTGYTADRLARHPWAGWPGFPQIHSRGSGLLSALPSAPSPSPSTSHPVCCSSLAVALAISALPRLQLLASRSPVISPGARGAAPRLAPHSALHSHSGHWVIPPVLPGPVPSPQG